ncbi:hypothetical protein KNP414_01708 [Paenibacillus mucilaginosus KNP414]|uniref:Alginate lyase domain-containing protein n=1 Tax=Paenibacillus mucilaginosus (strain KNP414) TaxID=1036673 RepID=F8FQ50_PAEMK|nr:hypothetical protein KNP414_01708 [Paenibacillus mucilaginosus KNP414]
MSPNEGQNGVIAVITKIDLLKDWNVSGVQDAKGGYALADSVTLEYPSPVNAVGWYGMGFERGNDSSLDAMGWYGLKLALRSDAEEAEIRVMAGFMDGRSVSTRLLLAGPAEHRVKVRLADFEIEGIKANIWRFLKSFELLGNADLLSASLVRGDRIYVETNVLGRSGAVDEDVIYTMNVHNCTDARQRVSVRQLFYGWESLLPVITPEQFVLEPRASQEVAAAVKVHQAMVQGGHETTVLQFVPNGDSGSAVKVEFKTLSRLPHPYIYHNEQQWRETREKIDKYPQFKPGYDQILADADNWEVKPPVPVDERDYCYDTHEEHGIMSAAYAYALTGEIRYAEKVAQFLRYFIDDETGYPRKKKGCSQSYVQEGHFFQHLAIPYDIIHSAGVLTPDEHKGVEKTFRIYMDILDHHIQRGHISNWLLSEITGAFYCALAIEDIERALRFVFGPGGAVDQLKYGLFNDGWWYECSVGYNTWVSSMFIHMARALLPFGYNILHTHFAVPFSDEVNSTYRGADAEVKFGMYNKKWGGRVKNYVCIKDMFDAAIPFLDYRGVLFGISDSDEKKLEGVHFGSTYDLAYHYYKDPEYIPVIKQNVRPDPIFGHAELPDTPSSFIKKNAYSDNIGIAMLRSQTPEREQREQIQAVLRYGSHGYAHGHFDRTALLSVMRYGRSFFNPEHVWWGYSHFMYKFYVQNSMTKNMVAVDDKVQVPSDSKRLLFYSGKAIQAAAVETQSKWAYPPYGGMVYNENETLQERCRRNASSLPELEDAPPYGEMSDFTEPIRQRRVMAVTDDYIVLFDDVKGEQEHEYSSLFQIKGFQGLQAEVLVKKGHSGQWTENPLSDAQFITDCHWYEVRGTSTARFCTIFGEGEDQRGNRTFHNTPGELHMDVHTAWPRQTEQVVGLAAEYHGITIPMEYRVEVDGAVTAQGEFGAWLLGEGRCDADLRGAETLTLRVKQHPTYNEQNYAQRTKQGLFWGEAYLELADGSRRDLSDLSLHYDNVDQGFGIGRDYEGGRVTIVGREYPDAIPASPLDHDREGVITLDLTGLGAVRFMGLIGADAFPGDEEQRRRTYGVRTRGKAARFITVVEPYEAEAMVKSVRSHDERSVEVLLKDGRTQIITVDELEGDDLAVRIAEYRAGQLLREETAGKGKPSSEPVKAGLFR